MITAIVYNVFTKIILSRLQDYNTEFKYVNQQTQNAEANITNNLLQAVFYFKVNETKKITFKIKKCFLIRYCQYFKTFVIFIFFKTQN